jgi:DNA polymerase III delta subunit
VLGDALPLVDRAVQQIFTAVRPKLGAVAFNHGRFRAGDPDAVRAFEAARTLPMMGELRLVELRDLHEAPAAVWEALIGWLQSPAGTGVVLAVGTGFPKVEKGGSNWATRVKNALGDGVLVQCGSQDVPPLRFVGELVAAAGKSIADRDAERIVGLVGGDLGRLRQEVLKLVDYVGDAPAIDAAAIDAATSQLAEAEIWDLTGAIARRDVAKALGTLHRLLDDGEEAHRLFAMVGWQVRELVRAADLLRAGASDKDVTTRTRVRWDLLRELKPAVLSGAFPASAELLRRLATANRQMNGHRAGSQRVLEGLVLELVTGKVRRPPPLPAPR